MEFLIWENDRDDGEAIIYGGWPRMEESFSSGNFITSPIPSIEITVDAKSQGVLTDNLLVMGAPYIFSKRLVDILKLNGVDNFQEFPCTVRNIITGEKRSDYSVINIVGKFKCIDLNNSAVESLEGIPDKIFAWEYLTLDESKILNQKMLLLSEMPVQIVVHRTIADEIEKASLTGIKFVCQGPVEF